MSTVVEVEGGYEIHMQTGITVEVNNASGSSGTNGVGIENIQYDGEEIVIEMTDDTTYGPFQVRGLQGEQGPQGEMGFMGPAGPQGPAGPAGTTDHSLLLNLNADDHTQYLNLNGRAGGQTLRGGTATGENLTLMSTNHATKGAIIFGDSRYNEATNRLILGAATGTGRINLPDAGTTAADGIAFGTTNFIHRGIVGGLTYRTNFGHEFTLHPFTILGVYANSIEGYRSLSLTGNSLTGSSATSALSISQTWNTTGNPSAIFANITNTASGANANLMDLQVSGVSRFKISKGGAVTVNGYLFSTVAIGFSTKSTITSPVNGNIRLTNFAENDFNLLQFGGTTSAFPSLKRNGAALEIRLADDSDFAATQSLYQRFGSGSPEGVVTAPVGAIYHRTDGGANTSLYVKESGTGNTGWIGK